jgi:hypothetical protein
MQWIADKSLRPWTIVSIHCFLSIYTCTPSVGGGKESVRKRAKALCRCLYTDDWKSLKGGYLCNWTFHNVVTDVTTFLNTPLWTVESTYLWCQTPPKTMWENMRSVLLYNPLKTQREKWRSSFLIYCEKLS